MGYTFFGVQVAIENFRRDPLRARLHQLIADSGENQQMQQKRAFWKRFSATVNEAMPVFARGTWDLIRGGNAEAEFETWTSELEGAAATEQEELGAAADEVNRLSAEKNYVLVTMLFLVEEGSNADLTLGERCDIPEADWFTRWTFARLVGAAPLLNFSNVQADAAYLVPGNEDDGLSEDDLADPGYSYLKPLG